MRRQKEKTEYIHIRLSKEMKERYLEFCEKNGCTVSKKIRLFIKNELNEEKNK